jgi:hypothetical protein
VDTFVQIASLASVEEKPPVNRGAGARSCCIFPHPIVIESDIPLDQLVYRSANPRHIFNLLPELDERKTIVDT